MKRLYQEKEESLGRVEKKLESLKRKNKSEHIRNLNKKIKYRDEKLVVLKTASDSEIEKLTRSVRNMTLQLEQNSSKLVALSDEKTALRKKVDYLKKKLENEKMLNVDLRSKDVSQLEEELEFLNKKVFELKQENKEFNDLIALLQDDEIVTFHDGRFSDDIRETIMELLSLNVSMSKVRPP